MAATAAPEVDRTNLVLREGRWYQVGRTNPFAGWLLDHGPDGLLLARSAISNGVLHGLSEGWHTNGQTQIREHFRDNVSDGPREKWYANGQRQSVANIVHGRVDGTFQRWHENGQLAERIELKQGNPEGKAWAFYPSGYVRAETETHAGEVLRRIHWEDGEKKSTE